MNDQSFKTRTDLRRQIKERESAVKTAQYIIKRANQDLHALRADLDTVGISQDPFDITDHAVLRYLERTRNIDINFIRNEMRNAILDSETCIKGYFYEAGNCTFVVREGNKIVTVLPGKDT